MRFTVLYDACVLYPAPLRDFLMHLALTELYAAKWTDEIHNEWIRNVLKVRTDLEATQLQRTRQLMNDAIPDSLVTDYQSLIQGLELPDANDRHVLAAAILSGSQIIVTFNLKDFPQNILDIYDIEALHPDVFIELQMGLNEAAVVGAAKSHRASLKNPPKDAVDYLETLSAQGLVVTAEKLRQFQALI
jgi:hypothetical protein